MMNKPNTYHALIRSMQSYSDKHVKLEVKLVISDQFDFTEYSFLRMCQAKTNTPMEEWVRTDELAEWKKLLGIQE